MQNIFFFSQNALLGTTTTTTTTTIAPIYGLRLNVNYNDSNSGSPSLYDISGTFNLREGTTTIDTFSFSNLTGNDIWPRIYDFDNLDSNTQYNFTISFNIFYNSNPVIHTNQWSFDGFNWNNGSPTNNIFPSTSPYSIVYVRATFDSGGGI